MTKEKNTIKTRLTPYSLTQRVLDKHHFLTDRGILYAFNGEYYTTVNKVEVMRMIKALLSSEELQHIRLKDLDDVAEHLRFEPEIYREHLTPESGQVLFNNGLFDIRTGQKIEHSPKHFSLYKVNANYDCDKETPIFDAFLERVSGNDEQIKTRILEAIGYCLLPDLYAKHFLVFNSTSDIDMYVICKLIERFLGADAVSNISLCDLHKGFALGSLVGKQLSFTENLTGSKLSSVTVSYIKLLTGGDYITVDEKGKKPYTHINTAKMLIRTNTPIRCMHDDPSLFERMLIVPFIASTLKEAPDKYLLDKLWEERNGIVYKAIQAANNLIKNNYIFSECEVADKVKEEWRNIEALDVIHFVKDRCDLSNCSIRTASSELYRAYCNYCNEKGLYEKGIASFAQTLKRTFNLKPYKHHNIRGYQGIRLKPQGGDTPNALRAIQ